MVPPAPRECNQPACTAHCIATSSQRIGPRISRASVERGNAADKLNGRNINVSFTNNSNVPIEVMVFIFYSDEIAIDVKTGLVTRHELNFL